MTGFFTAPATRTHPELQLGLGAGRVQDGLRVTQRSILHSVDSMIFDNACFNRAMQSPQSIQVMNPQSCPQSDFLSCVAESFRRLGNSWAPHSEVLAVEYRAQTGTACPLKPQQLKANLALSLHSVALVQMAGFLRLKNAAVSGCQPGGRAPTLVFHGLPVNPSVSSFCSRMGKTAKDRRIFFVLFWSLPPPHNNSL